MNELLKFAKKTFPEVVAVERIDDWHGFACYEIIFDMQETTATGLPQTILKDESGALRWASYDEIMQMLDE